MIVCTNCGTRNPDDAGTCAACGRKLQSQWALAGNGEPGRATAAGQGGAATKPAVSAGAGARGVLDLDEMGRRLVARENARGAAVDAGIEGGAWEHIAPVERTPDPAANRLVRLCAETWLYALVLVGGAAVTAASEDWRYLALAIVVAAGLAWARGI